MPIWRNNPISLPVLYIGIGQRQIHPLTPLLYNIWVAYGGTDRLTYCETHFSSRTPGQD